MEYRFNSKKVYVWLAILLIVLAAFILYFFRDSFFTGRAINIVEHAPGEPLKGTFTVTPIPGIGTIPYNSDVKLTFHSSSGDQSQTLPLPSFLSQDYNDVNLLNDLTFYPVLEIVIGFTPKQEGLDPLPDKTFKIRKSFDVPGVLNIDPNYLPYIKDVFVRGASLPHSQAFLVNTSLTHYRVGSRYQEKVYGYPEYAEDLVMRLEDFNLIVPQYGTLTAEITYYDTTLYSEFLEMSAGGTVAGGGSGTTVGTSTNSDQNSGTSTNKQPIIPFTPETNPDPGEQLNDEEFASCHDYTCEVFGECSIPSFAEISHGDYLSFTSQRALCHYTDCDKTFTFAKPCALFDETSVSIIGIKPHTDSSDFILEKYGTKDSFSSNTRVVSVIDQDMNKPVVNLIYDNVQDNPYLDVAFVQSSPEIVAHCFDATINYDETGTDCGGNECRACSLERSKYSLVFIWVAVCISFVLSILFYRRHHSNAFI